jgi:hypothetical protein
MAELNTVLNNTQDDLFANTTPKTTQDTSVHLFDKTEQKQTDNKTNQKQTDNKTNQKQTDNKTNDKTKNKSFFTLPIIILLAIILILIVVIIFILKFKTKNTDELLKQNEVQLQSLNEQIIDLEQRNQTLKQQNSKLNNAINTLKTENQTLMDNLKTNETFEFSKQSKPKTFAEHKAEKFAKSNKYNQKDDKKETTEIIIEQEPINMTNELKQNTNSEHSDDEENIQALLE